MYISDSKDVLTTINDNSLYPNLASHMPLPQVPARRIFNKSANLRRA